MNYRLGLIGYPIAHSLSPWIHRQFLDSCHLEGSYELIEINAEKDFSESISSLKTKELDGFNITVPYKEKILPFLDEIDGSAKEIGAVNTVHCKNGEWIGYNTDGIGYVRSLQYEFPELVKNKTKKILILGAGGAVRGVLEPLLAQHPAEVCIANRTVEKAEQLAREFADLGPMTACGYDWIDAPVDIIINGTSASLSGELPPLASTLIKAKHTICYDMMYGRQTTIFNQWAQSQDAARTLDGLGMLVEQAAEAFYLWTGVRPNPAPVLQQLRAQL